MLEIISEKKIKSIYLLFFISGMSALIYEIAWLNRIQLIMGHTIYALSTVLGAYLAGIAWGALSAYRVGGNKEDCLSLYLIFELIIGVYGILFVPVLNLVHMIYGPIVTDTNISLPLLSIIQFIFCGLVIFLPTFLMGATLPLLSKYLFPDSKTAANQISSLYGINTLGAFTGCLLAGYLLLPEIGYTKSIYLAAFFNLSLFLIATINFPKDTTAITSVLPRLPSFLNISFIMDLLSSLKNPVVWLLFFSGATSIFVQLLWNRLGAMCFGPSVFIFPFVTSVILLGIYIGSRLFKRYSGDAANNLLFLGTVSFLSLGLFLLSCYIINYVPVAVLYFNSITVFGHFLYTLFQFLVAIFVFLPAAICFGANFPAALSLFLREDVGDLSKKVGIAYGMNIFGILAGAILGGFVLVPHIGLNALAKSILLLTSLSLLIILQQRYQHWMNFVTVTIFTFLAFLVYRDFNIPLITSGYFYNRTEFPDEQEFENEYGTFDAFNRMTRNRILDYKDDAHGTFSVHQSFYNQEEKWFSVDGKVDGNSLGDRQTVRVLGYLPMFYKKSFDSVLTIGLGTGETASITHRYPQMKSSTVVELSPAMLKFSKDYFFEKSAHVFKDPRYKVINRDGREFLLHTKQKFDLIISEPSNPWVNGVASLYTTDFFEITKQRLNPGGIAVFWFHTYGLSCDAFDSVIMSVYKSFDHMIGFKHGLDIYFVVSNDSPLQMQNLGAEFADISQEFLELLQGGTDEEVLQSYADNATDADIQELLENEKVRQARPYLERIADYLVIENRDQLTIFDNYPLINTDDNQYLQFSSGKTFRLPVTCNRQF